MTPEEKSKKEQELADLLDECLESSNQSGSIISLTINDDETCTVIMQYVEVPEDNYIGFQGY